MPIMGCKGKNGKLANERIPVMPETKQELYDLKTMNQTWDDVVRKLLDFYHEKTLEADLDAAAMQPSIPLSEAETMLKEAGAKK